MTESEELANALRSQRYAYRHDICGKVALLFDEKPLPNSRITSRGVYYPSGKPVGIQDSLACVHCNFPMNMRSQNVKDLIEERV